MLMMVERPTAPAPEQRIKEDRERLFTRAKASHERGIEAERAITGASKQAVIDAALEYYLTARGHLPEQETAADEGNEQ